MKCFFYPNQPIGHVMNSLLGQLEWTITDDVEEADLCFWWRFPAEHAELPDILKGRRCVNCGCSNTLKTEVERRFVEAFGVTTLVDPTKYVGEIVRKSNTQAAHDGVIINCPIDSIDDSKVYQRFFGDGKIIYNFRVPIVCGEVPYVIIQYKKHTFSSATGVVGTHVVDAKDVFSDDWLERLKVFCDGYIDIAELDVIDNCIIDVNNTPSNATYVEITDDEWCKRKYAKLIRKYYKDVCTEINCKADDNGNGC